MDSRIAVKWENEGHSVLRVIFGPHWDWDDFQQADQVISHIANTTNEPIDLILDARNMIMPVSTLSLIPIVLKGMQGFTHRCIRLAIVAGNITTLGIVCSVIRSMHPDKTQHLYLVSTLDEALEITRNYVETNNPRKPKNAY
jgi:hypothetical protein